MNTSYLKGLQSNLFHLRSPIYIKVSARNSDIRSMLFHHRKWPASERFPVVIIFQMVIAWPPELIIWKLSCVAHDRGPVVIFNVDSNSFMREEFCCGIKHCLQKVNILFTGWEPMWLVFNIEPESVEFNAVLDQVVQSEASLFVSWFILIREDVDIDVIDSSFAGVDGVVNDVVIEIFVRRLDFNNHECVSSSGDVFKAVDWADKGADVEA